VLGSRMVWGPVFRGLIELVSEGVKTEFWGLRCPIHCQGTSVSQLLLAFVLGFGLAFGLFLFILYFHFLAPSRVLHLSQARDRAETQSPGQARLSLYGHTRL